MPVRRVSPEDARALMDREGYVYVDVRSIPEFEAGHPEGAYNVPIAHLGPGGMAPNPDFVDVMEKTFAKDARIVVGCRSGGRSLQAASILQSVGFTDVVDQRAGFEGAGGEPGWRPKGLPTSIDPEPGRDYHALRDKGR